MRRGGSVTRISISKFPSIGVGRSCSNDHAHPPPSSPPSPPATEKLFFFSTKLCENSLEGERSNVIVRDAHIASIESCKHRSTRVIDATSVRKIDRSRDRLAFYLMATRRSMTDGQPAPSRGNNRANAFIVICYDRGNLRGRWTESRFASSNEDRCRLVRRSKVRRLCSCFVVASDSVSKEEIPTENARRLSRV